MTENDGHENDGPSKLQGMKLQDMKMTDQVAGMKLQDMKMTDQVAGMKLQDMKIQHMKMQDTVSFSNEDTYILTVYVFSILNDKQWQQLSIKAERT